MGLFVLRRTGAAVLLVLVVSVLAFLLAQLSPTDPVDALLGEAQTPQLRAELERELGLDDPLPVQYAAWLGDALRGDFGSSYTSRTDVGAVVAQRLPVTLTITLAGVLLAVLVGCTAGGLAAMAPDGPLDRLVRVAASLAMATPAFWFAMVLVLLLAVRAPVFVATGWTPLSVSPVQWLRSLVLPAVAVSLFGFAHLSRLTRSSLVDVLARDHVRSARVRGLHPVQIVLRHGLRNALPPVVASIGLVLVTTFGITAVLEVVFALPGLGQSLVEAAARGDTPVVQAVALVTATMVAAVNLLADIAVSALDPRVRTP